MFPKSTIVLTGPEKSLSPCRVPRFDLDGFLLDRPPNWMRRLFTAQSLVELEVFLIMPSPVRPLPLIPRELRVDDLKAESNDGEDEDLDFFTC